MAAAVSIAIVDNLFMTLGLLASFAIRLCFPVGCRFLGDRGHESCRRIKAGFCRVFPSRTSKTDCFERVRYINLIREWPGYSSPNLPLNSAATALTASSASGPSARIVSRVPIPAPSIVRATLLRAFTTSVPRVMVMFDRKLIAAFDTIAAGLTCKPCAFVISTDSSATRLILSAGQAASRAVGVWREFLRYAASNGGASSRSPSSLKPS